MATLTDKIDEMIETFLKRDIEKNIIRILKHATASSYMKLSNRVLMGAAKAAINRKDERAMKEIRKAAYQISNNSLHSMMANSLWEMEYEPKMSETAEEIAHVTSWYDDPERVEAIAELKQAAAGIMQLEQYQSLEGKEDLNRLALEGMGAIDKLVAAAHKVCKEGSTYPISLTVEGKAFLDSLREVSPITTNLAASASGEYEWSEEDTINLKKIASQIAQFEPQDIIKGVDVGELALRITYATSKKNMKALEELKKAAVYGGYSWEMEYASKGLGKAPSRLDYLHTLRNAFPDIGHTPNVPESNAGFCIDNPNTTVGQCYQKIFGQGYLNWTGNKTTVTQEMVDGKIVDVKHEKPITYSQVPEQDRGTVHKMILENILGNPVVYKRIESQLKREEELAEKRASLINGNGNGYGQMISNGADGEPEDEMAKAARDNKLVMLTLGVMDGSLLAVANQNYKAKQQRMLERAKLHSAVMGLWRDYEAEGARLQKEVDKMNKNPLSMEEALASTNYDYAEVNFGKEERVNLSGQEFVVHSPATEDGGFGIQYDPFLPALPRYDLLRQEYELKR